MLNRAKKIANQVIGQRVKGVLRGHWYPVLLPHHQIVDDGYITLGGPIKIKPPKVLKALRLCDGTRTLSEVVHAAGVPTQALIEEEEADTILLWPERPRFEAEYGVHPTEGIILSPHLDDAALSMGSLMLESAARQWPFLVVDVFSTVSWWRFPVSDGLLPRVQTTRDAEEEHVMLLTRCKLRRWGLSEAPLRGYPLKEIFTTERLPEAEATHQVIRDRVYELAREKPRDPWYLPLAIGNHIDHRIARDAALDGLRKAGVPGCDVMFYEDLPYAAKDAQVKDYSKFVTYLPPDCALEVAARTKVTAHKHRLLRMYYSQLTRPQIDSVTAYAERIDPSNPCERLWSFDAATLKMTDGKIPG